MLHYEGFVKDIQWNANTSHIQGHHLKWKPTQDLSANHWFSSFKGSLADVEDRTLEPGHAAPHGPPPQSCWCWPWNFWNRYPATKPRAHFCGFRVKGGFSLLERDGTAKWTPFASYDTSPRKSASPEKCMRKGNASAKVAHGSGHLSWPQRDLEKNKQFQDHNFSEARRTRTIWAQNWTNLVVVLQGAPKGQKSRK